MNQIDVDALSKIAFERAKKLTKNLTIYLIDLQHKNQKNERKSKKRPWIILSKIYLSQNDKTPHLVIYNSVFSKIFKKKLKEDYADFKLDLLTFHLYYNNDRNILQYFYSLACPKDFPFCIWMNKLSSYLNEYFF